jgi:hypothetical protein
MKELYRQRMKYGNSLMRDMTIELVEDTVKILRECHFRTSRFRCYVMFQAPEKKS